MEELTNENMRRKMKPTKRKLQKFRSRTEKEQESPAIAD